LVLNLHRAAMENRKEQIKVNVLGFSVAVMNALDAAFGGGKGKILDNWLKVMDGPGESREGRRSSLSPNTRAFFSGAPVVTQKE
jgi:hypothetical protein